MSASAEALLEGIRRDNHSGAIHLTHQAGDALLVWLGQRQPQHPLEEVHHDLERFALELVQAKPTMASIFNLVNQTLLATAEAASWSDLDERLEATVRQFLRALEQSTARIAIQAAKLIVPGATLMTNSYSATAFAAFRHALSTGKRFTVICPESRPIGEGRSLAQELAQLGLRVKVVADAAAPRLVRHCDLVLVGGDALAPEGLGNKIGSYALALAARANHRPFVALVGEQKYLPRFSETWIPREPSKELLAEGDIENLSVENRYFELVPLDLLSEVVGEMGSIPLERLLERLQAIQLHPILAAL